MSSQDDNRPLRLEAIVKRFMESRRAQTEAQASRKDPATHLSPVRPSDPAAGESPPPQGLILPQSTTSKIENEAANMRQKIERAEEALITLREKTAALAADYAAGNINRAQFDAIYARYSEQRDITERLLDRDPSSQAWQSVVQPGHTSFLKQQNAAQVLSYAIYRLDSAALIASYGPLRLAQAQVYAILQRLTDVQSRRENPGPACHALKDGRCLTFVPGAHTLVAVLFSLEPATAQITQIADMHQDFERANQHALTDSTINADRLVFPYRALFE